MLLTAPYFALPQFGEGSEISLEFYRRGLDAMRWGKSGKVVISAKIHRRDCQEFRVRAGGLNIKRSWPL